MAAIKTLCLTSLFLIVSQMSALQTGNGSTKGCASSDVTIDFNFDIGSDSFVDRLWYKNSTIRANRIARVVGAGSSLTVESQYSGRIALNGSGGIILYNVTEPDSGSYFFVIVPATSSADGTATTTVNVYVNPNDSCIPIIEKNSADSFTCKISDACPGKDSIRAIWDDGSVGVFTCPSITVNTEYKCCAEGDPVTYCNRSGDLCTNIECKGSGCKLELGLGLGIGIGIQCVITGIVVVIFKCTGCKHAYFLGLVHGVGEGSTFQVGWIIIASLIATGNKCKLELGLGLGLGSGMPCVITGIIAVILFLLFKGIPKRVEISKGILTGLLLASFIGIIVVYLMYHKLKREMTSINHEDNPPKQDGKKHEQIPLQPAVTRDKTKNSGPPVVHTGTPKKVEPNTIISKQTNDRQRVPPADTGFEYRPQPPPPQNGEIKDRNLLRISATIEDKLGLANETHRPNRLLPLPPNKATVGEEDASDEPKKKKKKKKKKNQKNKETPEEKNGETILKSEY